MRKLEDKKVVMLKVVKCPDPKLADNNIAYISQADAKALHCRDQEQYIEVGRAVYIARTHAFVEPGQLGLNQIQRVFGAYAFNDTVAV